MKACFRTCALTYLFAYSSSYLLLTFFLPSYLLLLGALGFVPSCFFNYITVLGFEKKEALRHTNKMQAIVSSGAKSVKHS